MTQNKSQSKIQQDKVLIAIPCFRTILVPTINSAIQQGCDIKFEESIYVHNNRNRLIELAKDYTHIFFLDSDIVLPIDAIKDLLAHDKDVVSGLYNFRHDPPQPILYRKQEGVLYRASYDLMPDKLFKAFCAGAGCLLIKTEVFKKLEKPYFDYRFTDKGEVKMSEDMVFCQKLEDAGIELWVDPTLDVFHLGDKFY